MTADAPRRDDSARSIVVSICETASPKVLGNISETVGEKSTIIVEAMLNTIVFGVHPTEKVPELKPVEVNEVSACVPKITEAVVASEKPTKLNDYILEVLSVVTKYSDYSGEIYTSQFTAKANGTEITGMIAHAILKFPEGGKLITSAGHFCELEKIAVSKDCLMKELERLPKEERDEYIKNIAEAEKSGVVENIRNAQSRATSWVLRSSS